MMVLKGVSFSLMGNGPEMSPISTNFHNSSDGPEMSQMLPFMKGLE